MEKKNRNPRDAIYNFRYGLKKNFLITLSNTSQVSASERAHKLQIFTLLLKCVQSKLRTRLYKANPGVDLEG